MLPLFPQGVALGWWLIAPFRGAFVRTTIADGHCRYAGSQYPDCTFAMLGFVKEYSNFDPKKWGV